MNYMPQAPQQWNNGYNSYSLNQTTQQRQSGPTRNYNPLQFTGEMALGGGNYSAQPSYSGAGASSSNSLGGAGYQYGAQYSGSLGGKLPLGGAGIYGNSGSSEKGYARPPSNENQAQNSLRLLKAKMQQQQQPTSSLNGAYYSGQQDKSDYQKQNDNYRRQFYPPGGDALANVAGGSQGYQPVSSKLQQQSGTYPYQSQPYSSSISNGKYNAGAAAPSNNAPPAASQYSNYNSNYVQNQQPLYAQSNSYGAQQSSHYQNGGVTGSLPTGNQPYGAKAYGTAEEYYSNQQQNGGQQALPPRMRGGALSNSAQKTNQMQQQQQQQQQLPPRGGASYQNPQQQGGGAWNRNPQQNVGLQSKKGFAGNGVAETDHDRKVAKASGVQVAPPVQEYAEVEGELVQCRMGCGRSFIQESLQKHEKNCEKIFQQKRKEFNSQAHRIVDKEQQRFNRLGASKSTNGGGKSQTAGAKNAKKQKWKAQSEAFRAMLKATKGTQDLSAEEKNAFQNMGQEDYVECDHCGRKFNEKAAQKHIPWCQNQQKMKGVKQAPRRR